MGNFRLELDPTSPVPLYHQIAEALRYRIATGAIPIGAALPPLREAAELWSVNLHTVRRAYATLADAGIVETRAPVGTIVRPGVAARDAGQAKGPDKRRAAFLQRVVEEAREKHKLSVRELVAHLDSLEMPAGRLDGAVVHVAECSESQSNDLARQLEAHWRVRAIPWTVDRPEPDGRGAIVATLFHYNDLRLSWRDRFASIRFLPISPDPALKQRLLKGTGAKRVTVVLCERDESMLRSIASDVARILPSDRFDLETRIVRRAGDLLARAKPRTPLLVSPRIWGELPAETRADSRVQEVRYLFDRAALDRVGRELGWSRREEA